jgi:predicted PurR-regulated permease PerM
MDEAFRTVDDPDGTQAQLATGDMKAGAAPSEGVLARLKPGVALSGLFVLSIFYTLYFARAILLPIVLAALLAIVLSPLVKMLARLRIPEPVGAAAVLIALLCTMGYGAYKLAEPAAQWIERAPATLGELERKLRALKKSFEGVSKAAQKVEEIAAGGDQATQKQKLAVAVAPPSLAGKLLAGTQTFLVAAAATIVLLYFLLATGEMFLRRVVRVIPGRSDKKRAVTMIRTIESDIARYLSTITFINVGLGAATAVAMYLLDMPNPVLWGVLVALLNYVPFIGPFFGLVVLTTVAILTFDQVGHALLVPAVFSLLVIVEGQILTPVIVGRNLTLNPVIIFIGMLFWSWLWGIVGALIAVPILMTFKIVCDHVPSLAPVAELLSGRREEPVYEPG